MKAKLQNTKIHATPQLFLHANHLEINTENVHKAPRCGLSVL